MANELKILIGLGILTVVILIGAVFFVGSSSETTETGDERVDQALLINEDSYSIGSASASVQIVEFGDYQCPACASAHPLTKRIVEDYAEDVQFVFRHFPLPMHKNARLAALTAEAAGRQDAFWEMHDKLYENQAEWGESGNPMEFFTSYAEDLSLDVTKLEEDIKAKELAEKIDRDVRDGGGAGVMATPTFYINGRRLQGVPSYSEIQALIEEELSSSSSSS